MPATIEFQLSRFLFEIVDLLIILFAFGYALSIINSTFVGFWKIVKNHIKSIIINILVKIYYETNSH